MERFHYSLNIFNFYGVFGFLILLDTDLTAYLGAFCPFHSFSTLLALNWYFYSSFCLCSTCHFDFFSISSITYFGPFSCELANLTVVVWIELVFLRNKCLVSLIILTVSLFLSPWYLLSSCSSCYFNWIYFVDLFLTSSVRC